MEGAHRPLAFTAKLVTTDTLLKVAGGVIVLNYVPTAWPTRLQDLVLNLWSHWYFWLNLVGHKTKWKDIKMILKKDL